MTAEPRLSALLEDALLAAAASDGARLAPVSLTIEYGEAAGPGETATLTASLDRTTRTLRFVSGEAQAPSGRLLAAAAGVFRVVSGA